MLGARWGLGKACPFIFTTSVLNYDNLHRSGVARHRKTYRMTFAASRGIESGLKIAGRGCCGANIPRVPPPAGSAGVCRDGERSRLSARPARLRADRLVLIVANISGGPDLFVRDVEPANLFHVCNNRQRESKQNNNKNNEPKGCLDC